MNAPIGFHDYAEFDDHAPLNSIITPKAFANPSPGLERSDNPGINQEEPDKP